MTTEAELFADETPEAALVRVARRTEALAAPAGFAEPSMGMPMAISADEWQSLVADQVYCAFVNQSGRLPGPRDFGGIPDLSERERREMYGPSGMAAWQRKSESGQLLLTEGGEAVAEPLLAQQCLKIGPLHRRLSMSHQPVLGTTVQFDVTGWVTHIALATQKLGMFAVLELNTPLPMQPGNKLKFSVLLRDLIPPDLRALPPAALPDPR